MKRERIYNFDGLMTRLTSQAWAVGRIKKNGGPSLYFFMPAGYRDQALFWRNHYGL